MKSFASLVDRIKSVLNEDTLVKNSIVEAVLECTGGKLNEDQFIYKEGVLTITASPAMKNEIRLKEDTIKKIVLDRSLRRIVKIQYS